MLPGKVRLRRAVKIALGVAALLLLRNADAAAVAEPPPRARHVFIISLDQGSPAAIEKSEMPVLKRLAAEGAHTWEAFSVVPSLTLPTHVSMLSGLGVQKHQILWNDADPVKGFVRVPTIFSLAKERGLVTAMFVAKLKFKALAPPGTLDAFAVATAPDANSVAEAFAAQLPMLRPNVCLIHFADADAAGHKFGVESPEKRQALAECDAAIGKVFTAIRMAGLEESSVLIITADHGGHDRTPAENEERARRGESYQPGTHGSAIKEDVQIPWIAWGRGVKKGHAITAPVVQYDTAATVLWQLGIPIPQDFWGRPVTSAFE